MTSTSGTVRQAVHSFMAEHPPVEPSVAVHYLTTKLAMETDASDVRLDIERGTASIVIVDVRARDAFEKCHVPGAISLPYRTINARTTADIPRESVLVTYCWGPQCNASTKGALALAALGFRVKEMLGGLEYWRRENLPVEGTLGYRASLYGEG